MKMTHTHLEGLITRDTQVVINTLKRKDEDTSKYPKVIFVYTMLKYMVDDFGQYIKDNEVVTEVIQFLNMLVEGGKKGKNMFNNIVTIYENLRKNNVNLETLHQELVTKMSNTFVYIKYRQDTLVTNPRYQVKKIQQGPSHYLHLKYKNLDGTFGYNKDNTIYNHNGALNAINSKLLGGSDIEASKIEQKLDDLQIPECYYFGSFNGVYTHDNKNEFIIDDIKKQPSSVIKKVLAGEDLCIVGYGQSGAGKTSTLIFKKGDTGDIVDGIIIEMFKLKEFTDVFDKIEIKATDLYTYHWQDNKDYTAYDSENYIRKPILMNDSTTISITYDAKAKNWFSGEKVIGQIIDEIFEKREIEPTPNNPESSRSHLICCLTLYYKSSSTDKPLTPRKIIICDLAGVENVFRCDNLSEVLRFDARYNKSKKYLGKLSYDSYFKNQGKTKAVKNKPDNLMRSLAQFDKENINIETKVME
jgi:hypothetical protein